ncbi:MAG: urea carboxylase-associated family protein [Defluviicoccus sp.]|nr:urea carboxylase-associated family protein [Defluviicoccus sp.]MDE0386184.1 urea carboxylase-associated family protein [Defluviicoccus sp.]
MAEAEAGRATLSMAGTGGYAALGPDAALSARYRRIARREVATTVVERFEIPAREGRGFAVAAGQVLRIGCPEGPQVADFIVFSADDPTERFWSARTRVFHGGHLDVGDRLWSTPPRTRPMMTLIADTVAHLDLPDGARSHDLLFCRCDARLYELVHGRTGQPNCQDNLAAAIAPFGLGPEHVPDPFNIFMTTGLNADGRPFYLPSDARKGDYVELIAEIDCLAAVSACPGGSSGPESLPLAIEILDVAPDGPGDA